MAATGSAAPAASMPQAAKRARMAPAPAVGLFGAGLSRTSPGLRSNKTAAAAEPKGATTKATAAAELKAPANKAAAAAPKGTATKSATTEPKASANTAAAAEPKGGGTKGAAELKGAAAAGKSGATAAGCEVCGASPGLSGEQPDFSRTAGGEPGDSPLASAGILVCSVPRCAALCHVQCEQRTLSLRLCGGCLRVHSRLAKLKLVACLPAEEPPGAPPGPGGGSSPGANPGSQGEGSSPVPGEAASPRRLLPVHTPTAGRAHSRPPLPTPAPPSLQ
ncbi:hypothetical protein T492DRAFT_1016016 [Pavlovales sp. CCMP2436]|nr:hypothetical protein T492DRAFT_1016016 [Pavlovales sp. CCMP2436]